MTELKGRDADPAASQSAAALPGPTSDEGARREGRESEGGMGRWVGARRRAARKQERLEEQDSAIPVELYGLRRGTVSLLTTLAFLFAIFTLVPIAWIVINSTKTQANIFETFGFWFASPFSFFHNFSLLFRRRRGEFR